MAFKLNRLLDINPFKRLHASGTTLASPLHGEYLVEFSPKYYLRKYYDVKNAGVDPWKHYQKHGWKEGRNPSPLFSNDYYVKQVNFLPDVYKDPLSHYLFKGRSQGIRPHPIFNDVRIRQLHVGIVTVAYNCSDVAILTVRGVANAKSDVKVTYFLIDGGSKDAEKQRLKDFCANFKAERLSFEFIDLPNNLGFSGSNNVGISKALASGCTHICLLNPDVVVADYWLERMISCGEPFVSPVSNAVGNEQTVPCNYQIERSPSCFAIVNDFASKWAESFEEVYEPSEFVGFFCALISRETIEAVGLFDERFSPGGYEDLDYCIRARQAGVELSVARHVYLHHWGSSSFSNLPMSERLMHADVNRRKFQEKHGMPWIDWKPTIFRSALDDFRRSRPAASSAIQTFQQQIFDRHKKACEALIVELNSDTRSLLNNLDQKEKERTRTRQAVQFAESQRDELVTIIRELDPSYRIPQRLTHPNLIDVATCESIVQRKAVIKEASPNFRERAYSDLLYLIAKELVICGVPQFWAMRLLLPAISKLAEFMCDLPLVIFANGVDPAETDDKDGYLQRVLAIDQIMGNKTRIYVRISPNRSDGYRIVFHPNNIASLDICSDAAVYTALLAAITKYARLIYIHSILPIGEARIRNAVTNANCVKVIDMHGAVPEEFLLQRDRINSICFSKYESEIVQDSNWVVCVSEEMMKHLAGKYSVSLDKFILCPIFGGVEKRPSDYLRAERPRLIYAGGTQAWQNVAEMAKLVAAKRDQFDYVILSPDPESVRYYLTQAGVSDAEARKKVYSANRSQLLKEYSISHYGFLLRDDSVINRVACPTKLVEYLTFGIVPILNSESVGDFVAMGMQFVSASNLKRGIIPTETERQTMAAHNLKVAHELRRRSQLGLEQIKALMNGNC